MWKFVEILFHIYKYILYIFLLYKIYILYNTLYVLKFLSFLYFKIEVKINQKVDFNILSKLFCLEYSIYKDRS